jgi:catechol 2,3-dioxygenase-like lactoylglutathione lyase family enzyme
MSITATGINALNLVIIPVADQDREIEFYEKIGFEKHTDVAFGNGYRWVEVYLPGGSTGIALAPPPPDGDSGNRQTGISLSTDDADATHEHLKSLGVDVDPEVQRMGDPVPPMFWFRDPEGNSLLIVETTSS